MTREEWLIIIKKAITDIDGLEWEKGMNGLTTTIRLNRNEAASLYELMENCEPKTGKWINTAPSDRSDNIICDQCGYNSIARYDYCPNCGSDNRGEGRMMKGASDERSNQR